MLDIATEKEKNTNIYQINLRGRIDSVTGRDFESYYDDMIRSGNRWFLFDASYLDFVSSAGIGSFVRLVRRLETLSGGGVFVNLNEEIRLTLEFFGLDKYLPVFTSIELAMQSLEERIKSGESHKTDFQAESNRLSGPDSGMEDHYEHAFVKDGPLDSPGTESPLMKERRMAEPPLATKTGQLIDSMRNQNELFAESRDDLSGENPLDKTRSSEPLQYEDKTGTAFRVIRCEQCGVNLKVYYVGEHMCSECAIRFRMKGDGSVTYFEKL